MANKLNLAIYQPALPKYRIPVFEALNNTHNVKLFFGNTKNLPNADQFAFAAETTSTCKFAVPLINDLMWDSCQTKICGDSHWDCIILPWNTRYLSLIPALIRARFNRIPTILWGHGVSKKQSKTRSLFRNLVTKLATATLFYDVNTREKFLDGKGGENVFAAPNAIDQKPIQEQIANWNPEKLRVFAKENDIENRRVILFVSRLEAKNRLDLLIESLATVKQRFPDAMAVIIGNGIAGELERLQSITNQVGMADSVRFLGPIYDETELAPWFLSSKFFCYPTNMGLSLMHAFGYGLPVVTGNDFTQCGPEVYAFKSGVNGLEFEYGSSDDLANVMLRLLDDPQHLEQLAEGARSTIANEANIDQMVAGFNDAIAFTQNNQPKPSAGA